MGNQSNAAVSAKLRTEIEWWFPGGLRIAYTGTPKTRWQWMRLTWRGYWAMWCLLFHAARIIRKSRIDAFRDASNEFAPETSDTQKGE